MNCWMNLGTEHMKQAALENITLKRSILLKAIVTRFPLWVFAGDRERRQCLIALLQRMAWKKLTQAAQCSLEARLPQRRHNDSVMHVGTELSFVGEQLIRSRSKTLLLGRN
jgi:hypothetical protein